MQSADSAPNATTAKAPEPGAAEAAPLDVPGAAQSRWFIPVFLLAVFGVNLASLGAIGISIPLRLGQLDPANKASLLSLAIGVGGIITILATPPFGRLSDASRSRFGIRRPFILVGSAVGAIGLMVIALAPSAAMVIVGWAIASAGFAAPLMALHALLADQIPHRIRAQVSAFFGLANTLGPVVGGFLISALPAEAIWWFGVPALAALLLNLGVVAVLRDIRRTERTPLDWRSLAASFWVNPVQHRDFAFAWLCRLLVTMGMFSVLLYGLYFITDELGVPQQQAPAMASTGMATYFACSIATTFVFARISDRTGRRKAIVGISAAASSVGLLVVTFSPGIPVFLVGLAIAGLGQGAFISVDVAMMTEVLPSTEAAGKDLGVVALAYQLPHLLVPVIAVPLISMGDGSSYRLLFATAAVLVVIGALAVIPLKKVR
jgi:MFS family permease